MKTFLTYSMILLLMLSCGKNGDLEEGDRNTFTWKGKLVKDCNGEPASNVSVHLEIDVHDISESQSDIVAEAVTDSEGNFSLTYKKLPAGTDGVSLYKGGMGLLSAPVNINLDRDVAIEDCDMIRVEVSNLSCSDSLYLVIGKVKNSEYRFSLILHEIDSTQKYPVLGIPLFKTSYQNTFIVQTIAGHTWDNKPIIYRYSASSELSEVRKALLSYHVDTIEDGYNTNELKLSGYPKIDTIYIEL